MDKKEKALKLRREGKSFREISREAGIALGTAHKWTRDVFLSKRQKVVLVNKSLMALQKGRGKAQVARKFNYQKIVRKNFNKGKNSIKPLSTKELDYVCAALYWAEGFKKDSRLGFANSDPTMIRLVLKWMIESLKIPKDNIRLRVGINMSFIDKIKEIEKYWSKVTRIDIKQFQKPFFQKTKLKKKYPVDSEYYGVLRIRAIGQNENFRKILGMVSGLREVEVLV